MSQNRRGRPSKSTEEKRLNKKIADKKNYQLKKQDSLPVLTSASTGSYLSFSIIIVSILTTNTCV